MNKRQCTRSLFVDTPLQSNALPVVSGTTGQTRYLSTTLPTSDSEPTSAYVVQSRSGGISTTQSGDLGWDATSAGDFWEVKTNVLTCTTTGLYLIHYSSTVSYTALSPVRYNSVRLFLNSTPLAQIDHGVPSVNLAVNQHIVSIIDLVTFSANDTLTIKTASAGSVGSTLNAGHVVIRRIS